jgi:hypothetical protein
LRRTGRSVLRFEVIVHTEEHAAERLIHVKSTCTSTNANTNYTITACPPVHSPYHLDLSFHRMLYFSPIANLKFDPTQKSRPLLLPPEELHKKGGMCFVSELYLNVQDHAVPTAYSGQPWRRRKLGGFVSPARHM